MTSKIRNNSRANAMYLSTAIYWVIVVIYGMLLNFHPTGYYDTVTGAFAGTVVPLFNVKALMESIEYITYIMNGLPNGHAPLLYFDEPVYYGYMLILGSIMSAYVFSIYIGDQYQRVLYILSGVLAWLSPIIPIISYATYLSHHNYEFGTYSIETRKINLVVALTFTIALFYIIQTAYILAPIIASTIFTLLQVLSVLGLQIRHLSTRVV